MYDTMNKRASESMRMNNEITFDFDGKIIQIKKPLENSLPSTIELPKVKFK
jgi:hypothetical protein